MSELARGEFEGEIAGQRRKDEIGVMARSLEVFRQAEREHRRLADEASAARRQIEAERRSNEASRQTTAAERDAAVAALAQALARLADGDLTARLAVSGAYHKLGEDFGRAVFRLNEAIAQVAECAGELGGGADDVSRAAEDLSRRTEAQASSLEQTAAALGEMTADVARAAEASNKARKTVIAARGDAERSGAAMQNAVKAMNEIEHSSRQIADIVGVIDEIAFQTNLLALNAAVEAARAGEQGKGFAVVASEVRQLALRSAEAAKEIRVLLSTSGAQVAAGVKRVGDTGASLHEIVGLIAEINNVVASIASGAQSQASGVSEINAAVGQLDRTTQENAAMVEEATAAAQRLESETRGLAELVAQFRVGAGGPAGRRRAA